MAKIELSINTDKVELKNKYQQAITDLTAMSSITTNTQAIAAIKKQAILLLNLLKVMKRMVD
jgi:hypothetical protein